MKGYCIVIDGDLMVQCITSTQAKYRGELTSDTADVGSRSGSWAVPCAVFLVLVSRVVVTVIILPLVKSSALRITRVWAEQSVTKAVTKSCQHTVCAVLRLAVVGCGQIVSEVS